MEPEREAYEAIGIDELDMGKACIRFSCEKKIPWDLIAELSQKLTVAEYIERYDRIIKDYRKRK